MTTEFVLAYVPRKMKELGFGNDYVLAFRELVVPDSVALEIDAQREYYFFIGKDAPSGGGVIGPISGGPVRIESEMGVYDLSDTKLNEIVYEHTGKITISNASGSPAFLQFIVVIPVRKAKRPTTKKN
jgi:hypothetical protein